MRTAWQAQLKYSQIGHVWYGISGRLTDLLSPYCEYYSYSYSFIRILLIWLKTCIAVGSIINSGKQHSRWVNHLLVLSFRKTSLKEIIKWGLPFSLVNRLWLSRVISEWCKKVLWISGYLGKLIEAMCKGSRKVTDLNLVHLWRGLFIIDIEIRDYSKEEYIYYSYLYKFCLGEALAC